MNIQNASISFLINQEEYEEFSTGFLYITTRGFLGRQTTKTYIINTRQCKAWISKSEIIIKIDMIDSEYHYPISSIIKWEFRKVPEGLI